MRQSYKPTLLWNPSYQVWTRVFDQQGNTTWTFFLVLFRQLDNLLKPFLSTLSERSAKRARLEQAENQAFVQSVSSIHIDEDNVKSRRDDEHNATEARPITPPLSDVGSDMVSPLLDNKRVRASDFVPVATANSTPFETLTPTSSDFAMTTPCKPQQCEPLSQALVFKTPAPVSAPSSAPAATPVPTFQTPAPKAKAACASDRTPAGSQLASRTPAPVSTGKKARPPIPDPVNPWKAPADRWAAAMACVFRYVSTPAMLQAARVARSWRAAAQAPWCVRAAAWCWFSKATFGSSASHSEMGFGAAIGGEGVTYGTHQSFQCSLMTSSIAAGLVHGILLPRSSWETVDVHTAWRKVTVDCVRGITAARGAIVTSFVLDQCFGIKDEVLALIAQDCPNLTRLSLVGCWCVWDTTPCIGVSGTHAILELRAVVNLTHMLLPSQGRDRPGHQARRRAPASPQAHQPQQVRSPALVHGDPPCIPMKH
jgi:hypothetical protein